MDDTGAHLYWISRWCPTLHYKGDPKVNASAEALQIHSKSEQWFITIDSQSSDFWHQKTTKQNIYKKINENSILKTNLEHKKSKMQPQDR